MDDIGKRKAWFERYMQRLDEMDAARVAQGDREPLCPCCGYATLGERGGYAICPICDWEDDGQDDPRAEEVWGGPNGDYSLAEARRNFQLYLTMYRESDEEKFERETSEKSLQAKRALIDELSRPG